MHQISQTIIGPYPRRDDTYLVTFLQHHFGQQIGADDALQMLVIVLHHYGYLDDRLLRQLSRISKIPLSALTSLCSFYSFLDQPIRCRYRIQISTNIIDEHNGARNALEFLRAHYRDQSDIVIQATSCTGFSDLAPGALVNGIPITRFTLARAQEVAGLIDNGTPMAQWPSIFFDYHTKVHRRDILLNHSFATGSVVTAARQRAPTDVLAVLRSSGLCGRGGGGFPTWQKWTTAAEQQAAVKYVVCNADEGEPGTFKDRILLQDHFDAVIEGMIICAHVVGATAGLIYLRGEYLWLHEHLNIRLQHYRQLGLLDEGFDIHLHVGAGAYVCGEETALIESLEGKRGIPRIRPPFPAQQGYRNAPTVVNNVETFCAVTWILAHGAEAFSTLGNTTSTGTKLHSLSGDCNKPGIYEVPMGSTVASLLALCEAEDTLAVQVGGPSGRLLFPHQFDTPIDFAHVSSGGSFMVFSHQRDPLAIVQNFAHFFAHESCGFCTPCRAGTHVIATTLDAMHAGTATQQARKNLGELCHLLRTASHCGLGQTAACALIDLMHQFPERFDAPTVQSPETLILRCPLP